MTLLITSRARLWMTGQLCYAYRTPSFANAVVCTSDTGGSNGPLDCTTDCHAVRLRTSGVGGLHTDDEEAMSDWISVETATPDEDVPVWCLTKGDGIFIG